MEAGLRHRLANRLEVKHLARNERALRQARFRVNRFLVSPTKLNRRASRVFHSRFPDIDLRRQEIFPIDVTGKPPRASSRIKKTSAPAATAHTNSARSPLRVGGIPVEF